MNVTNPSTQAASSARNLTHIQEMLGRSLTRISSGKKIVDPADDPAGLAASSKMDAQTARVNAAAINIQNAASYLQTSDGLMAGMATVLSRMGELAVLTNDVTKSPADVSLYQQEFTALQDQLRSTIGGTTAQIGGTAGVANPLGTFNGQELFAPNPSGLTVTIGGAAGDSVTINTPNLRDGAMLALIQQDGAGQYTLRATNADAVAKIESGTADLGDERAVVGAVQSRLELAGATLQVEIENLTSAVSRIRDADIAKESTRLAKYNILSETGTTILAQANKDPKSVLQLLQR